VQLLCLLRRVVVGSVRLGCTLFLGYLRLWNTASVDFHLQRVELAYLMRVACWCGAVPVWVLCVRRLCHDLDASSRLGCDWLVVR
jgi:hypothetical protein